MKDSTPASVILSMQHVYDTRAGSQSSAIIGEAKVIQDTDSAANPLRRLRLWLSHDYSPYQKQMLTKYFADMAIPLSRSCLMTIQTQGDLPGYGSAMHTVFGFKFDLHL